MDTKYKLLEPMMTSNTTPEPFIVKASSVLGNSTNEFICFSDYNIPNISGSDCWHSKEESKPFIQIYLGDKYNIKRIGLRSRKESNFPQRPSHMNIEISNDEKEWNKIRDFNISGLSPLDFKYFDLSDNTLYSSYIRFSFTSPTGYVALNRIQIYYNPDLFLIKDIDCLYSINDNTYTISSNSFNKILAPSIKLSDFLQYGFYLSDINNKINNINKLDIINKQCDGDFKLIRKSKLL